MSENAQKSDNTRNVLIGAAVAVVVAAFAGYQVGFGNGESGLKEVQDKLGQMEETAKAQAGKVEEQAAALEAGAAEVKTQAEQIEKLTSEVAAKAGEVEDLTGKLAAKTAEADALGEKLSAANSELADVKANVSSISARLSEAEQQSENYLATIMADMRKQLLLLHVGGMQETLIENTAAVGLSFVSRADKTARVTLSGEQLELKLQEPENIRIEGRACALTLVNLISDTDAMLELSCSG